MPRLTDAPTSAPRDQEAAERDELLAFTRGWRAAQSALPLSEHECPAFADGWRGWHGRHFKPQCHIVVTPDWTHITFPATAIRR